MLILAVASFLLGCVVTGLFRFKYREAAVLFYQDMLNSEESPDRNTMVNRLKSFKIFCLIICPIFAVTLPAIWIIAVAIHYKIMAGAVLLQIADIIPLFALLGYYLPEKFYGKIVNACP